MREPFGAFKPPFYVVLSLIQKRDTLLQRRCLLSRGTTPEETGKDGKAANPHKSGSNSTAHKKTLSLKMTGDMKDRP
jgi:hypothetical protein